MKIQDFGGHRDFEANSEDFGGVSSAFWGGVRRFWGECGGFWESPNIFGVYAEDFEGRSALLG